MNAELKGQHTMNGLTDQHEMKNRLTGQRTMNARGHRSTYNEWWGHRLIYNILNSRFSSQNMKAWLTGQHAINARVTDQHNECRVTGNIQ